MLITLMQRVKVNLNRY